MKKYLKIVKNFPFLYAFLLNMRKLVRELLWKKKTIPSEYFLHEISEAPFKINDVSYFDPDVAQSLNAYNQQLQNEYLIKYSNYGVLEPNYGWIIKGNCRYLVNSLPYTYYTNPPKVTDLFAINTKGKKLHYKNLVSLHDVGAGNYFHFINDTLTKLCFLKKWGIPSEYPHVISKEVGETNFYKHFKDSLNDYNIIFQDKNEYMSADNFYLCKSLSYKTEIYEDVLKLLKIDYSNTNRNSNKVFIDRAQSNGRNILNKDRILDILGSYGYQTYMLEDLTLEEQTELFYNSSHVIGIHGAGLTNIIYRYGAAMSLLELFPPNNIPPHYYWLSKLMKYKYQAIVGDNNTIDKSKLKQYEKIDFIVDEVKLIKCIKN